MSTNLIKLQVVKKLIMMIIIIDAKSIGQKDKSRPPKLVDLTGDHTNDMINMTYFGLCQSENIRLSDKL